jgi:oligoribonuclease
MRKASNRNLYAYNSLINTGNKRFFVLSLSFSVFRAIALYRRFVAMSKLVWVDCEMTGLGVPGGVGKDRLLEIAIIVTDSDLSNGRKGPNLIIHQTPEVLASMNDWCKNQFGYNPNGQHEVGKLAHDVTLSTVTEADAERQIIEFVSQHVEPGKGLLSGNSVHADKRFLEAYMPNFMKYLHYRILDVSTVKEICSRWYPEDFGKAPPKANKHRALDDIEASIDELKFYRSAIFKPSVI